ncbi:PREDICTED: protein FAM47E [Elephantulus edwardii]|uniref:protein FAM47E n=1 Tax=Elephantulus edwardii TaxID=28737 RepID=UPI0003F0DE28|nr:PREDICTED: protein FAM47E [Elephantulus edwardii]
MADLRRFRPVDLVPAPLSATRRPCQDLITKAPNEAYLPLIYHRVPQPPKTRKPKLPKGDLTSRLSAAQRAQKAFVEDVEASLTRHPLALYPNLEEKLPVELLSKVLEILDPERKLKDTWAYCEDASKRTTEQPTKHLNEQPVKFSPKLPRKTPVSRSHEWVFYENTSSKIDSIHDSPLYENVRKEIGDFCKWATSIGSSKIDEEFILKQFDFDYETQSNESTFSTKRPSQISQKKMSTVRPPKPQKLDASSWEPGSKRKFQKQQQPQKQPWVKMRYGAWYLDTKLWKRQRADEPLVDPEITRKVQEEKLRKEKEETDEVGFCERIVEQEGCSLDQE